MCLTIAGDEKPQIAVEDIVVYKYLYPSSIHADIRDKDVDYSYLSPYYYAPYNIGERYESELASPFHIAYGDWWVIDQGLHTFEHEKDAWADGGGVSNNIVVVKCRIPAGASYYKGEFSTNVSSYASSALILDELVDRPE